MCSLIILPWLGVALVQNYTPTASHRAPAYLGWAFFVFRTRQRFEESFCFFILQQLQSLDTRQITRGQFDCFITSRIDSHGFSQQHKRVVLFSKFCVFFMVTVHSSRTSSTRSWPISKARATSIEVIITLKAVPFFICTLIIHFFECLRIC